MEQRQWTHSQGLDFGDGPILVRVTTVDQLFNPIDPLPLAERALDERVATWIEEWAADIDRGEPLDIEIHVADGGSRGHEDAIASAIQNQFEYWEWQLGRELRTVFREGRISLLIGVVALAAFSAASRLVDGDEAIVQVIHEGLAVLGWVAMWKPLNIFLYDWWPLRRERRACHRIAAATVTFPTT